MEVLMVSAVMLSGSPDPAMARDTMFAVVKLNANWAGDAAVVLTLGGNTSGGTGKALTFPGTGRIIAWCAFVDYLHFHPWGWSLRWSAA
jgi:hypothetical protein